MRNIHYLHINRTTIKMPQQCHLEKKKLCKILYDVLILLITFSILTINNKPRTSMAQEEMCQISKFLCSWPVKGEQAGKEFRGV